MADHGFLELLPAYAAGALSPEECRRLEEHLKNGCEICEPELYMLSDTAASLVYALPSIPVPGGLKEKLREKVGNERAAAVAPRGWSRMTPLLAAAILIVAVASWMAWRAHVISKSMESTIVLQQQEIERLEKTLKMQKAEIQWLRDPAVQLALLTGLEIAPGARARMIWHPGQHRGILYVQSVPPLKEDKSYQLWVIGDKGPVSAGVFVPDAAGSAVLQVGKLDGSISGSLQFAVTIEPRGGVPQPTGSMILAGKPL